MKEMTLNGKIQPKAVAMVVRMRALNKLSF